MNTRACQIVFALALFACHSEETKKDPSTQRTGTVASPAEAGSPDPGPPPGPTYDQVQTYNQAWAALLDQKFEEDAPADAAAQEAEAGIRTKAAEAKAKATDATINVEGLACKANFCRAKVTFGSLAEHQKYHGAFSDAFFGRWSTVEINSSETEMRYFVGLKGGELPLPPR